MPDPLPPPQAANPPNTVIKSRTPSIDRKPRRRAGIPRKTRKARTAPPVHAPPAAGRIIALPDPVVVTVTVAVPVVVPLLRVTVELPPEQVGRSFAPVGEVVSAQVSVTVPA